MGPAPSLAVGSKLAGWLEYTVLQQFSAAQGPQEPWEAGTSETALTYTSSWAGPRIAQGYLGA